MYVGRLRQHLSAKEKEKQAQEKIVKVFFHLTKGTKKDRWFQPLK